MNAPLFSIVTPVYNPSVALLTQTIDSVLSQTHKSWEWILVDDASPNPAVIKTLRTAAARDQRIKVIERPTNGHIVAASNDALRHATGSWIVLLDHDDLLTTNALESISKTIDRHPNAGYIYSDEDKVAEDGTCFDTFLKPDWSPERLRHQMYLGHLSALRTDLVKQVGGFHAGFDGSQDHDLALRVTEVADEIVHIPDVLYHWRASEGSTAHDASLKPYAQDSGVSAVNEHLTRLGLDSYFTAYSHPKYPHTYCLSRQFREDALISVIIPTRGSSALVWGLRRNLVVETVRSLLAHTHRSIEIVVVYDVDTPGDVLRDLQTIASDQITLVSYSKPFNFSEKCNLGFCASHGDYIVLLNDDLEIITDDFLDKLCAPLIEPTVGATGARLYYTDGTIQHACVTVHYNDYSHPYMSLPASTPGHMAELRLDREVAAVTGAVIALRRSDFVAVGGLSEYLPVNFNDVDLCLKIRRLGLRIIALADVCAYHFESQTRSPKVEQFELDFMRARWGIRTPDPYMRGYNSERHFIPAQE